MNKKIYSIVIGFIFVPVALLAQGIKLGKLTNPKLSEVSGIIPYSHQKNHFWVHNDSGDKAQIYLIDDKAGLKSTVQFEGINVVDCEDIARVNINSVPYLLLADIGNNLKNRDVLSLYLFPEPKVNANEHIIPRTDIKKIDIKYADKKRDAEAIFIDPVDQEVYIISKRDFKSALFSFSLKKNTHDEDVIRLLPQMELPFTFTTSADISPDGRFIVVKNLTHIYLWPRNTNNSIIKTLAGPYIQIPYTPEPQGEAVCFDLDDRYIYTISERPLGLESYLYKYKY